MKLSASNDFSHVLQDFTSWTFQPSGDYADDCHTGRRLAREFIACKSDPFFSQALGFVVMAIKNLDREMSGLEVGFFAGLGALLAQTEIVPSRPRLTLIDGGAAAPRL